MVENHAVIVSTYNLYLPNTILHLSVPFCSICIFSFPYTVILSLSTFYLLGPVNTKWEVVNGVLWGKTGTRFTHVQTNRWAKNNVLEKIFVYLQKQGTIAIQKSLYKSRNDIERLFRKIKRFRRIFTRYDKLDSIFLFFIYFAFIFDSLLRVNRP